MKEQAIFTGIILFVEILVVALALTAYKKKLRKTAKKNEIIFTAVLLSCAITISLAVGIPFVGIPWAIPAYIITVFFLQWLVSQEVMDQVWKIGKAWLSTKGLTID